ncbi:MAG TPA: LysR substrate-binding domain-containing protein [Aestuariivirga sp.]|nr:LysR substrate-binding domain-containing protein [Aestuariivirga sp.]
MQNLLALVRTVETGRLRSAAQSLNVTESAISHQIARLERQLGVVLLERGSGGVTLTKDGKQFYERIRGPLRDISEAAGEFDLRHQTRVSLTMPQSFAAMWFAPRLYRLSQDLPEVEIDILPTSRVCDLAREKIDFGIRMGEGAWQECSAVPLVRECLSPVCSVGNAPKIERLGALAFLSSEPMISNALHGDEWQQWCAQFEIAMPPKDKGLILGSFDLVANAVLSGSGIAMGRSPLIDSLLGDGRLMQPFPEKIMLSGWYYLVTPNETPLRGARRRVHNWLIAEITRQQS